MDNGDWALLISVGAMVMAIAALIFGMRNHR